MNHFDEKDYLSKRKPKDINLIEIYKIIKRRLWLIIVITAVTTILGTYYSYSKYTPLYQTSSRIIIKADPEYRNTLQVIIKDSVVLDKVIQQLELNENSNQLASNITVSSIEDTQVVSIGVIDTNPKRAAEIANATARVFQEEIPNIVNFKDVTLLSKAMVNDSPINQGSMKMIIISIAAGLIAGVCIVFLLDSFDDSLRGDQEVEEILGLPVLGKVSKMHRKNVKKKTVKQLALNTGGEPIGFK
jgi:capsular polysaccharide biosynthesis protein